MAPSLPPGLNDDLIGDILLRLPPQNPECLVRASVVCKPWRRFLSDPGFPRRYREFHGAPPLLGFLHNTESRRWTKTNGYGQFFFPRFIPFRKASPILNPRPEPDSYIIDCRHGRVLLFKRKIGLIIWDPITNISQNIGQPEIKEHQYRFTAAVLCAVVGCDHLGCCGGPSLVVFVKIKNIRHDRRRATASASANVYSTETSVWNAVVSSVRFGHLMFGYRNRKTKRSSLLAGDALYFVLEEGWRILKYDLTGCGLSLMSPPPFPVRNMMLMKAEDGGLGAAGVERPSLHLWAWRTGSGGIWQWERDRVIQLDIGDHVFEFAEGAGSIFLRANGVLAVELKSGRARKILQGGDFLDIFPFMSFYTPEIMPPPDCKGQ